MAGVCGGLAQYFNLDATLLRILFVVPEPRTDTQPGVPAQLITLSWKSFTAAADQAGISREYGGIHFNDGDFETRKAGEDVGQLVWSNAQDLLQRQGHPQDLASWSGLLVAEDPGRRRPFKITRCASRDRRIGSMNAAQGVGHRQAQAS